MGLMQGWADALGTCRGGSRSQQDGSSCREEGLALVERRGIGRPPVRSRAVTTAGSQGVSLPASVRSQLRVDRHGITRGPGQRGGGAGSREVLRTTEPLTWGQWDEGARGRWCHGAGNW